MIFSASMDMFQSARALPCSLPVFVQFVSYQIFAVIPLGFDFQNIQTMLTNAAAAGQTCLGFMLGSLNCTAKTKEYSNAARVNVLASTSPYAL